VPAGSPMPAAGRPDVGHGAAAQPEHDARVHGAKRASVLPPSMVRFQKVSRSARRSKPSYRRVVAVAARVQMAGAAPRASRSCPAAAAACGRRAAARSPQPSARAKARSASARSARKGLGCQPTRCWTTTRPQWSPAAMVRPAFAGRLTACYQEPSSEVPGDRDRRRGPASLATLRRSGSSPRRGVGPAQLGATVGRVGRLHVRSRVTRSVHGAFLPR
jgi:hypothetical protein